MHLDSFSNHSFSPEPLLHQDFQGCDFGPPTSLSSCFCPPKISIEAPSEGDVCSSLLSASSVISGALEELHSDVYLSGDEWGTSLENFLTSLPDTDSFLDNSTVESSNQHSFPPHREGMEESCCLLDIPASQPDDLEKYLGPPYSRCSVSPMSVSPAHSSISSPYASARGSLTGSFRRQKRPHSVSPLNAEGMDFNAIIRSSPTCLNEPQNSAIDQLNVNMFTPCGTYGHVLPKLEHNNNEHDNTNLSFQPFLINDSQQEKSFDHDSFTKNFLPKSYEHVKPKSREFQNENIPSPIHSFSSIERTTTTLAKDEQQTPQEEDRSESPDEDDGPRICRWVDCNITFPNRENLSRHIERSHIDQRKGDDFTCFWAACQRRYRPFNARYKLLIHMRVHSGEKPNKCTFKGCTKAFSRLENLKIHLRSHTGERPYVCVYQNCSKAFSNSSDRAKHQRTHVDAKPYVCSVPGCKKRYTDPSSLRKHVKNHTSKEQALAKRKMQREDIRYCGNNMNYASKASMLTSSENTNAAEIEDCNVYPQSHYMVPLILGRVFQRVFPGLCGPLQPPVSRALQAPLGRSPRGSPRGYVALPAVPGRPRCLGEPPLNTATLQTPKNVESSQGVHMACLQENMVPVPSLQRYTHFSNPENSFSQNSAIFPETRLPPFNSVLRHSLHADCKETFDISSQFITNDIDHYVSCCPSVNNLPSSNDCSNENFMSSKLIENEKMNSLNFYHQDFMKNELNFINTQSNLPGS